MLIEVNHNTTEGGTGGAEEKCGGITRAFMVTILTLSKGATTVDEGATTEPSQSG